jgi:hypothetical protein
MCNQPRSISMCILAIALLPSVMVAQSTSPQASRINSLIEQLGSPSYQVRRSAESQLGSLGLAAFEQLRKAHFHPNVQVAETARYLLKSQNVIWWLDTDPHSIRQLLQDYNQSSVVERETAIQRLGLEKSIEARAALVRLARYEVSETASKQAALALLKALTNDNHADQNKDFQSKIREAVGESDRTACQWLLTFADGADLGSFLSDRWQILADEEYQLLQRKKEESSRSIVTSLYRWIGETLANRGERKQALSILRPSLELISKRDADLRQAASWAIDANLPEFVADLAERHKAVFDRHAHLGYLLAESFLKVGDQSKADATAEAASKSVQSAMENVRSMRIGDDLIAEVRKNLGRELSERGMYPWAEREMLKGLELALSVPKEFILRVTLAEFYAEGQEYQKAAECLGSFLVKIESMPEEVERLRREVALTAFQDAESDLKGAIGTYNYYLGMHEFKNGSRDKARSHLELAVQSNASNPDLLIALSKVVEPGVNDAVYQSNLNSMIQRFRQEIQDWEHQLLESANDRTSKQDMVAESCNQLAWLLSNTNQQKLDALQLSKRSLELKPDTPEYLDTLARCYFANEQFDLAVTMQEQAVRMLPFNRAMVRQLEEFKAKRKS